MIKIIIKNKVFVTINLIFTAWGMLKTNDIDVQVFWAVMFYVTAAIGSTLIYTWMIALVGDILFNWKPRMTSDKE